MRGEWFRFARNDFEIYAIDMSVAELLKHVESLSPNERKELVRSIQALDKPSTNGSKLPGEQEVKWPDIEARAREVFGDRVLPNLVLQEREERGF
jgi:hypothetical protein